MRVSLTKRIYPVKPDIKNDRTLRFSSKYFDVNIEVSSEQLCQALVTGHQLFPPVKDTTEVKGKIPRTGDNVMGREYVMVDIESDDLDKIPELTPETFAGCELAPSFVYASYSDGAPNKGHRYHLVWCFADTITDPMQNEDIWSRCRRVALDAMGDKFEDDRSVSDFARVCFGSFEKPYFSTNGYKLYNLSDFDRIEPFMPKKLKASRKGSGAAQSKSGVQKIDIDNIYDEGDHFSYERRMAVIFALYYLWGDADKVREIYESIDPHRKDPGEGESLIASAVSYEREGKLRLPKIGLEICKMLKHVPWRHDYSRPSSFDAEISVPKHISDRLTDVLSNLGKATLLVAPPGSGKTVFSQKLSGNVLVVQMMKSIVDSSKYTMDWVKVYGKKQIPAFWETEEERAQKALAVELSRKSPKQRKREEKLRLMQQQKELSDKMQPVLSEFQKPNSEEKVSVEKGPTRIVCTIDKLKSLDVDKLKHFDYIVLDESHIIFESSGYRRIGFVFQMFNELISSEWGGRLILMTGTPILEPCYFKDIRTIKIIPEKTYKHTFTTHKHKKADGPLAAFIAKALREGKKVFFPSNSQREKTKIMNIIRQNYQDVEIHHQDFCKDLHFMKDNIRIRNKSEVPDETNILTCTVYMSVGLDIFDKGEWVIVMKSGWIGQQIVQFANRLRERDLDIHYFYERKRTSSYKGTIGTSAYIDGLCQSANKILATTNGVLDPVHQKLLKRYPCIVFDNSQGCYAVDELLRQIYLDWIDYRDYQIDTANLFNYLESYGYKVISDADNLYMNEPVKRHSQVPPDANEILANCLYEILDKRPDIYEGEEIDLVDKNVLGLYKINVQPYIRKIVKLYGDKERYTNPEKSRQITYQRLEHILHYFLKTVYDEDINRYKSFININSLRKFAESHLLSAKVHCYTKLFNDFHNAVVDFVTQKPLRTRDEIEDFIMVRARIYAPEASTISSVEDTLKEFFRLFVSKGKVQRRYENYEEIREYPLLLTEKVMGDLIYSPLPPVDEPAA